MDDRIPGHALRALCLLGYCLAVLLAAHSLTWPFGYDQAQVATVGRAILDGGVPYRDAWDVKGPLTHYTSAFATWMWPSPVIAVRILDLLALVMCCLGLRRFSLRLMKDDQVADVVVVFFVVMYYSLGFWDTAEQDGWAAMIILGAVMLQISPHRRGASAMSVAGFLIATATLFKPTFVIFLALPVLFPPLWRTGRYPLVEVAACIITFSMTIAVALLALMHASGGLEDLMDAMRFNAWYAQNRSSAEVLLYQTKYRALLIPFLLCLWGIHFLHRSGNKYHARVIAAWILLGLVQLIMQGKYYPYHAVPLIVAMVVPCAIALRALDRAVSASSPLSRCVLMYAAFLVCLAPPGVSGLRDSGRLFDRPQAQLATYIAAHTGEGDRIQMWGDRTSVYALSDRRSSTRFPNAYPLVMPSPVQSKYRRQYVAELSRNPPRYIIVDSNCWTFYPQENGLDMLRAFPELNKFLSDRYSQIDRVGVFQIWQLKEGQA